MPNPIILAYAKPPRWSRRRRTRRLAVIATVSLLSGIAVAERSGISERCARARALYWQRQCLSYTLPPDQAVADVPPRGAPLVTGARARAACQPQCWRSLSSLLVPDSSARAPGGSGPAGSLVFLHARENSAGQERLVAVEFVGLNRTSRWYELHFRARTVRPASWDRPPLDLGWQPLSMSIAVPQNSSPSLRLFAARPDDQDRGCFTIAYELDGYHGQGGGTIHGGMCGDDVTLTGVQFNF